MDPFVRAVQKKLVAKGYTVGRAGADGLAGADTTAALLKFQVDNGLRQTGTVTEETWRQLDTPGERAAEIAALRDRDPTPSDPDWNALPTLKPVWPRQADVEKVFGPRAGNQCTAGVVRVPYAMRLAWEPFAKVTTISCHEKVAASAQRVFDSIAAAYSPDAIKKLGIDRFGGCFNDRSMRGSSRPSMHAYGIAMDFDPIRNQLKWKRDRARLDDPDGKTFFDLWEAEGWLSLGRARDFDWMHVQAARL